MAQRLTALLLGIAATAGCSSSAPEGTQAVSISGRTFHLELALTDDARYQGLSDRAEIAENGGMLFVFPYSHVRRFVMRRCLVPIDIIFLDAAGRVVAMHQMNVVDYDLPDDKLPQYSSRYPAQFAIELKGQTLDELDLETGNRIDLPLADLKRRAK